MNLCASRAMPLAVRLSVELGSGLFEMRADMASL